MRKQVPRAPFPAKLEPLAQQPGQPAGDRHDGRYHGFVTTREKVEKLLDRLSEDQLEAEYMRLQRAVQGARAIDEWGDLDRFSARASLGVLRHLDEEEAKVGFSWDEHRPT